ncbi:DUF2202 domain-containing protein [Pontiellaceae bacterium B1224]|nr:DUF2202 domain-containing protein [Pontiellaceae bacterium B1224]
MKVYTFVCLALTLSTSVLETKGKEAGRCCVQTCGATAAAVSHAVLPEATAKHLLYMREEEKLARDVYTALGEKYNQRVFINIPRAEQSHMNAILTLLNQYEIEDPALAEPGRFNNSELQALYDALMIRGNKSREEAFLVGALVEEVDILDLQAAIAHTDNEQIASVLNALLGGSKRHLNAFVRNYEAISGKTYVSQKMEQAAVNEILGR